MSFFDWNGDGMQDWQDDFIEYNAYMESTGEEGDEYDSDEEYGEDGDEYDGTEEDCDGAITVREAV